MENTSVVNNDLTAFYFVLITIPAFFYFLSLLVKSLSTNTVEVKPVTFDDIKEAAMQQAANGDQAARKWVTDHVFKTKPTKVFTSTPQPVSKFLTDKKIMNEAVMGLVAVKYKKEEAKKIVARLCKKKKYKDVAELLGDCFKK